MPNPQEVATVVANGMTYNYFESIQIERRYDDVISHMRLQVAENSSGSVGGAAPELMPLASAQGYLGGVPVISGQVCIRQAQYDKDAHTVLIVVASATQNLAASTVDGNPGFYQNYPFLSIANAVANKVGVNVALGRGAAAAASKIFPRVAEHIGETRYQFIARLAAMRNLFLIDDAKGTLMATQGVGGMAATLIEGQNIEAARLTLRNDEYGNPVRSLGAQPAGSQTTIDDNAARSSAATVTAPNMAAKTPVTVVMPQPGDDQDAAMYAARVAAWQLATYIDGEITVPGWFLDNGDLWINHVGDLVSIQSPMLVPGGNISLAIKGVIHRQDSVNGTQTVVEVCDPGSLGSLGEVQSTGGAAPGAFTPPQIGTPIPGG